MRENNSYGGAHLMLAFLAGAAAGAAVALMTAPRAGKDTRDTLKGWAKEAHQRVERVPVALKDAFDNAAVAAKEAFNESLEKSRKIQDAEKAEEEA